MGKILADGGEGPGIAVAKIDLDEVTAARAKIPSLSHDRPYQGQQPKPMAAE